MDVISGKQLALIKHIDFERGCGFVEGQCRRMQLVPRLLCCKTCARNIGYLKVQKNELPEDYAVLFTLDKGFLGETGCKLPKEKRSVICSCYACINCDISDEERVLLVKVEKGL